jgi:hypothetical protein
VYYRTHFGSGGIWFVMMDQYGLMMQNHHQMMPTSAKEILAAYWISGGHMMVEHIHFLPLVCHVRYLTQKVVQDQNCQHPGLPSHPACYHLHLLQTNRTNPFPRASHHFTLPAASSCLAILYIFRQEVHTTELPSSTSLLQ